MGNKIWFRTLGVFAILMLVPALGRSGMGGEAASVKKATFAAGCFWGVEKILGELPGVVSTRVGYAGGRTKNPSYEEVCSGRTGHAEAVEITYDPSKISYEELLLTFWQYHDPTTKDRQGPDIGSQYRSVIFYHDDGQKVAAEKSVELLGKARIFKNSIVTEIITATDFYKAEETHQKYLKKNPKGYCSHHLQSHRIAEVLGPTVSRTAEG